MSFLEDIPDRTTFKSDVVTCCSEPKLNICVNNIFNKKEMIENTLKLLLRKIPKPKKAIKKQKKFKILMKKLKKLGLNKDKFFESKKGYKKYDKKIDKTIDKTIDKILQNMGE